MVIYKITCSRDKRFYIGASLNPHTRHLEHFNHLRKNKHHNIFLQRAWNKYGEDSFAFEIVEYHTSEEEMWNREIELIEHYSNLYNAMPGGVRGPRMYGKDNPKYGKPISEKQRRLQSESMSGENHPFYGKSRPNHTEFMKSNNPMHTHNIDFSGDKNPNAKHFDKIKKITILRDKGYTWNKIAEELEVKSAEYIRRFWNRHKL